MENYFQHPDIRYINSILSRLYSTKNSFLSVEGNFFTLDQRLNKIQEVKMYVFASLRSLKKGLNLEIDFGNSSSSFSDDL